MTAPEAQEKPNICAGGCPFQVEDPVKSQVEVQQLVEAAPNTKENRLSEITPDSEPKAIKPPEVAILEAVHGSPDGAANETCPGEKNKLLEAPTSKRGSRKGPNTVSDKAKVLSKKESVDAGTKDERVKTSEGGKDEAAVQNGSKRSKTTHRRQQVASVSTSPNGGPRLSTSGNVLVKAATLKSIAEKLLRAQDTLKGVSENENASAMIASAIGEINQVLGVGAPRSVKPRTLNEPVVPTKPKETTSSVATTKKQPRSPPSPRNNRRNPVAARTNENFRGNVWKSSSRTLPGQIGAILPMQSTSSYSRSRATQPQQDSVANTLHSEEHPMAAKIRDSLRRATTTEDMESVIKQAKLYQLSYEVSLAMAFMRKKAETNR